MLLGAIYSYQTFSTKTPVLTFLAFLVLYLSASIEVCCTESSIIASVFKGLFLIVLMAYFIKNCSINIKKYVFLTLFCVLVFFILALQTTDQHVGEFISYLAKFLLIYFFCIYCKKYKIDFDYYLCSAILFIASYSLFLFIPFNLLRLDFLASKFYREGNFDFYYNFANIYFYRVTGDALLKLGSFELARLSAIFWEPGVYGVFLSYSLFYIANSSLKLKKDLIIICSNIILTFSATSLCIMLAILGIKFFSKLKWYIKLALIAPLFSMVFGFIFYILYSKMNASSPGLNSYGARMLDITVGVYLFSRSPLFGTGFFNVDIFQSVQKLNRGSSNGAITWLYTMGLNGIFFAISPFIINLRSRIKNMDYYIYMTMLLLLSMTEPIPTSPFMTYILAKEYAKIGD